MSYYSKAGSGPRKSTPFRVPEDYAEMLAATPLGGSRPAPIPGQALPQKSVQIQDQNPYRTLPQTPYQAPQPPVFAAPAPGQVPTQAVPQPTQMQNRIMVAPDEGRPF